MRKLPWRPNQLFPLTTPRTLGVGDRADESEVVDVTPDFYARSISIHSCALYIFIRETVSPQSPAVALARLKKTCLKKPNKTQQNYDQTPFTLDGHMDLDISLDGKTMCTTVYKKTNAQEQLLQSEGVCSLLGLLHYHSEVEPWRGGRKQIQMQTNSSVPSF